MVVPKPVTVTAPPTLFAAPVVVIAPVWIVLPVSVKLRDAPVVAPVIVMLPWLLSCTVSMVTLAPSATAPVIETLFPATSAVVTLPRRVVVEPARVMELSASFWPIGPILMAPDVPASASALTFSQLDVPTALSMVVALPKVTPPAVVVPPMTSVSMVILLPRRTDETALAVNSALLVKILPLSVS